jgi:RHS repeat-associated protein
MTVPFLSFTLSGQSPWWVPLVRGTGEVYVGRLTVMSDTPNGTWYANLAARDRAGNGGSAIRAGDRIVVDTTGPAPERVALYPEPPVRNDAAAPTSLVAVAVFAPSDIPAVQPECEVRLQPSAQDWRPVALDPLTAASWSGSIAFDAAAGAQPQTLEMRVTAADDLGNIATTRVDRSHWIVYQGDLPALPPPAQVVGAARPGGRVEMSWGAMDGACDFEVRRRGPGAAEAVVCGRTGGATSFAEAAPEGTNLYAVSTVRCAPADESVGPASAELALVADATPPGSPMGLRLALGGSGLQLSWTPPAALDVVSYNAYRSVDRITATSVANLAPILRAASGCGTLDADPPQRPVFYAVTALDAAGNESEPSEAAYTNLTLVPVTGLSVSREGDGPPSLEWRHAAAEGISGYRVHAVDANGRCLLSGEVLAPAITRFTDVTCGRAGRVYEVSAVDLAAGIEKESAARRVSLPWLDVSATPDALLLRGLMNRLSFSVRNAGPGELTDAVLTATAGGVSSVSPAFSVAEGSTGEVSVVMPGSASLPDVVSVTARVDQVSIGGGERATVIGTHRVPAGNGLLTAELRHGGVIRGGVAGVSFVLTNPGAEDVELITARGNGSRPSDEVRFFLETSDGFVLAAAPLREVLGEQEITLGDGTTVLRVQAGGSACVGETSLNVPSTAEGRVVLRLTVDRLHHGLGSDHPLRVEGFTTTCEAVLTDTPYTAVAREAVPNVSRGGDVRLRGEALRRDTGEPAADCPVAVTVRNGATTHTLSCTSGSNGVWECVFTPPALSSGAFDVWAGHPDERASLGQCSFSVNRIAVTPDAFDVTLPRNYEQRLSVTVTAADTLSLTNARLACRKEDQLPPGLHVEPAAGRFLPAGEAATLGATLWGDNRASATGRVVWSVVSDGESEPWASVPVRYRLTEAAPALTLLPERLLMGVTAGARNTSELRVGNSGQADLEGVTAAVRLPDGGPAPAWIRISPAALGDIQPGAWRDVVLSAEPDGNVVPGWLECQIVLSASNHAQAKMGAAVVVSESGAGDFLFRVSDLYYGQVTGASTNTGVSGATVRVRRAASLDAEQTRVTDRRGEALFRDLQAGTYDYRITADGHDAVSGSVRVDPGVTGSAEVFMPCRVVSVEWRVVPTLIEDRYEVVLSATYETDVPAAVVVCNPTSVTLPDMSRGDVFRGEIRLKNVGLIRADNIRPAFPTPDAFFRVELSGPCPTVLAAGQEAVVPYRVTCLSPTSGEGGAAGGVYSTTAQFSYESTCAKEQVQRSTAQFYVLGSTDSHGTPVVWDPGPLVVTSPGGIGSSSSSSPRPPATSVGANRCTEDLNVGLEIEEPDLAVGCGVTVKVTVDGCIDEGCPASHSVQLFCDPSATITPRVVSVPVGGTAEAVLRGVCGSKQVRTDQVTALLGDKTVQVPFTVVEITGVEAEKEVGVGCSTQARAVVLPEGWPVKWSLADQYGRNGDVLATIDESTGVVRIDKQSAYGWVSARAEAAGVACPELSGKQAKIEIDCVECPSCDKVGGNGHAALSSFHVNIYLGTDSEGETAGRLYVFEESLGTNAWTPSGLRVAVDSDAVRVLHDTNGWVRQVLAPDGAADVVCTNASGYVVRWYGLDQSAGVATNGVHLFDGEPVSEWAISRVGSGDGGTTRVDVVKTEDGLSVTNAFETRDAGGTWILTQGNGLTRTRRVSEWASADTRVIRTEVSGVDSGVVSRTVEWEAVYPWGRETVRREVDAGGEILVSTWAYGTDSSVTGQYGRVLADTAPGGGWTRYEYDATGRLSRVVECWKDQPSGTPAERAKVTTYGYAPVDPRDDGSLWPSTARSTRTEVCGVLTESSYAAYFLDAGGRRVEVSEACVQAGNAYGTPGNPRTVTTYQPEDGTAAAGRVVRVEQSDGALETCAYAYGTWTASVAPGEGRFEEGAGTAWRRERVRGTLADPAGLPLRTTRDVTIRDATGRTVMESTEVFTGEDYQRVGWTARAFDNRGREVQVVRSNGETTEQAWGCCGKERDVDAAGGVQVYALDALSRQIGVRRMGVVDAEFGSQPDLTTEYGLDAAGRQVSLTRRSEDGTAYRSTTAYDLAGYATNRTTEAGVRMAMSRLSGGRIERTVLPGGLERVGEAYRSGAAKCTTEDGRLATWSDYGVAADGTTWATTWAGPQGTNAAAWERTVSDALGRTARVEAPGFGGGIILTNVFIHDESGRRVRAAAPGVADTLYAYDELGEQVRTALDINGNGRVDLAGPDRVWESRSRYERGERLAAGGGGAGWWQVQTEMCYPFENSATPVTNSVHRQRLTGFDAGCTSEEEFVDAWGNVTVRRREVDRTRRLVRTTVDTPESSTNGVQVELNGRPVYSAAPTGVELWHACDGFGRRVASTNPATGGTRTGYGSDDRVLWTEDGEGARTTYGFDPDTGRVVASTNALTNATYVAYDLWGRPVAQWGSAYPVRWTYDSFGRRASMGTLRDCSVLITNASDFAQHSNALDVTRWVYDEATGLLREKWLPDAGGTTGRNARVRYAYTAAGRLAARSWARGLMTRYAYDPASGLLTNIEYEGGDTPGVSVRRDRMGRPVWVQDGQGERTMSYGGRGELEAEAVAGPDGYRIGYGYAAAGVAGRLEAVTTDAGWSVTYGYDGGGRLSAISGEATTENGHRARTATYRYQAGTDRIAGWESDDGWSVSRTYEPRRPWLASAESAADGVAAVCHEYRADSVGRRTERKDSGALLVAAVTNSFGYNPRNELVSAADGAHAYTYAFDPVGNRLSATVDEIETRYAANALNAYTQIVTGAEMTGLATDADGNLLSDGTWRYKWDTENRLVACDPVVETNGARRLRFAYDHAGRRVSSEVDELAAGYWVARRSTRFMWDGWHMLGERTSGEEAGGEGTWQFHVWGPDVSGVPGGVGGVGGLVFTLASDGSVFEYGYDGNGNVSAVRESVSGTLTALDYTPFGAPLSPKPGTLPRFGFSTKYTDPETGLCYYGYRYYSPAQGRWLSRDPIGEAGGVNLYGFVGNDPVNGVDSLGLAGYFFGGTGNSLEPGRESNVEIIFRAWDLAANGSRWYVPGVFSGLQPGGEKNGVIDTMGTPLEGAWGKTLGDRAGEMMRHLEDELQAGDREVNVFGFSRGSATALEFLNRIQDKVSQGDPRYKCVRVKCVMLWDTVTHTSADYRSELPKGMTFDYQPLHFIALDERRSEFFDKEVLDVQGSLQIGYRGVHADVGGGYADSAFDWISRNDALYAAGVAGLRFDQGTLKKYPSKVNWAARPTTNDKWFYNGNEARSFPNAMYLHWSVGLFGAYSKPLNNVEGREDISREVWKQWSHQDWAF